jgi:RNA polymerase Rpb1, domain 5
MLEEDDIYSNDIYAILKTYGVEMARAAILKEMGGVFGAYNIQVDRRHLELIADYMVRGNPRSLPPMMYNRLFGSVDVRGWLQAFQSERYIDQPFTIVKSIVRNDSRVPI